MSDELTHLVIFCETWNLVNQINMQSKCEESIVLYHLTACMCIAAVEWMSRLRTKLAGKMLQLQETQKCIRTKSGKTTKKGETDLLQILGTFGHILTTKLFDVTHTECEHSVQSLPLCDLRCVVILKHAFKAM